MSARSGGAKPRAGEQRRKVVADNRRARFDYEILDTFEAGIVLAGSEVKSLREAKVQLREGYARVDAGELWLYQVHISPWGYAADHNGHDPDRRRKLLLHRREIHDITVKTQQQSLTVVPLSMYFKDGRAKVELGLARGKQLHDKRRAIAERQMKRDVQREMADALRGR